jgi:bifunctional DNA-binding transcriptional regulator/antitoxin component of YhaV-PrlF toxin-antitoxin module
MQRRDSTVSSSGVTTVPKIIRDALGLDAGGRIQWVLDDTGELLVFVKHRYGSDGAPQPARLTDISN